MVPEARPNPEGSRRAAANKSSRQRAFRPARVVLAPCQSPVRSCVRRFRDLCGLAAALLLGAAPLLHATGLVWRTRTIDAPVALGQAALAVDFHFRNATGRAITIASVQTSCGCTAAAVDPATYPPGASGHIRVLFHVGDFTGLHDETITVATDEPGQAPDELLLRVEIPQFALVAPRVVTWQGGGRPETKTITCVALPGYSIEVTGAASDQPELTAEVETAEAGKKYYIRLTPASTSKALAATIRLRIRVADAGTATVNAYASVVPPT